MKPVRAMHLASHEGIVVARGVLSHQSIRCNRTCKGSLGHISTSGNATLTVHANGCRCLQEWQATALEALAAWLAEDGARLEARLEKAQAASLLTGVFREHAQAPPSEALARMLDSSLRILRRSPRITVCLVWYQPGSTYQTSCCVAPDCKCVWKLV